VFVEWAHPGAAACVRTALSEGRLSPDQRPCVVFVGAFHLSPDICSGLRTEFHGHFRRLAFTDDPDALVTVRVTDVMLPEVWSAIARCAGAADRGSIQAALRPVPPVSDGGWYHLDTAPADAIKWFLRRRKEARAIAVAAASATVSVSVSVSASVPQSAPDAAARTLSQQPEPTGHRQRDTPWRRYPAGVH
jgi:hypothetical protein